jgi:hypothetical protein
MKVATFQPYAPTAFIPQELFLVLISLRGSANPSRSAAGRNMSMKNSSDTIGNRTRDLPACTTVSQPTAPPRAPTGLKLQHVSNQRTLLTYNHTT